jgi:hypothetical protein
VVGGVKGYVADGAGGDRLHVLCNEFGEAGEDAGD